MKTIYKYPVQIENEQIIIMPRNAKLLTIQCQHNKPMLWALVDTAEPLEERRIRIAGTGHDCRHVQSGVHIATFQMTDVQLLIWHAFDYGPNV